MATRLSHSGKTSYSTCSEKYRLHYIENLRSPKVFSALFFGSALDEAFSRLLIDKKAELTDEEKLLQPQTAEEVFYDKMLTTNVNGAMVSLPDYLHMDYYGSDFAPDLIQAKQVDLVNEYIQPEVWKKHDLLKFMDKCKASLKAKERLTEEDYKLYNYITWLSLVEKGYMMVDAYRKQVMPKIEEVFSIQKKINITNEHGDSITGLIDFVATFTDEPGVKYICDNKTSSKPYEANSVLESAQLATYCEHEGTDKAAYVVIQKTLYKKAPIIHTQIIRSTVPETTFRSTFAEFEDVVHNIEAGKFEKNFGACFEYGRMCPFYSLCKHGNMGNLVKVEKK